MNPCQGGRQAALIPQPIDHARRHNDQDDHPVQGRHDCDRRDQNGPRVREFPEDQTDRSGRDRKRLDRNAENGNRTDAEVKQCCDDERQNDAERQCARRVPGLFRQVYHIVEADEREKGQQARREHRCQRTRVGQRRQHIWDAQDDAGIGRQTRRDDRQKAEDLDHRENRRKGHGFDDAPCRDQAKRQDHHGQDDHVGKWN